MILEQAPEPSDIIWENRFVTDSERRWKNAVKWAITIIFLILVGIVIFWMQIKSLNLAKQWPVSDCVQEEEDYGESSTNSLSYDTWVEHSFSAFMKQKQFLETADKDELFTNSVILECFCRYEAK
jgi:hypothetical protein